MADDRDDAQRTEEPTQKRLDDAFQQGDIVKSGELISFIVLAGGTLALALFLGGAARRFAHDFLGFLEHPADMALDSGSATVLMRYVVWSLIGLMAPAAGFMMATGL